MILYWGDAKYSDREKLCEAFQGNRWSSSDFQSDKPSPRDALPAIDFGVLLKRKDIKSLHSHVIASCVYLTPMVGVPPEQHPYFAALPHIPLQ